MSTRSTTRHSSVKVAIPAAGIGLLALTACGDPHEVPEGSVIQTFDEQTEEVEQ